MNVELHILQNLAPSNVNRDDTGSPKECQFGGSRRARISSQSWKRAIRDAFTTSPLLSVEHRAIRTKRIVEAIRDRLSTRKLPTEAERVAALLVEQVFKLEKGQTSYLLFLAPDELDAAAALCLDQWDILINVVHQRDEAEHAEKKRDEAEHTGKKREKAVIAPPIEIKNKFIKLLDGQHAADLALFGRMIADLPNKNVDAACQMAHAISTHSVNIETDYYTAIDDLQPTDMNGAGMIGTVEFASACFYRYTNIDTQQLLTNLGDDHELAQASLHAFLRAMVTTIPSGKQHSMAAYNPPSFVMAVVRETGNWSLANAFVRPIQAKENQDLVTGSITALDQYWGRLTAMYGKGSITASYVAMLEAVPLHSVVLQDTSPTPLLDLDTLYMQVMHEAFPTEAQ